jgi:hypothetical protein
MEAKKPSQIFAIKFIKTKDINIEQLLSSDNVNVKLIEQSKFDSQELS